MLAISCVQESNKRSLMNLQNMYQTGKTLVRLKQSELGVHYLLKIYLQLLFKILMCLPYFIRMI